MSSFSISGVFVNALMSTSSNLTSQDTLLSELYNTTVQSVVSITTNVDPRFINPANNDNDDNRSSLFHDSVDVPLGFGSGFIYDKDGHIVTNYHVLEGGTSADVKFLNGNSYSATLVGKDPLSDLAVLQIDPAALFREKLVPLELGSSSALKVGQQMVAIGNPVGIFSGTLTEGIISQLNGIFPDLARGVYSSGLIQIDVPITHGNSGGPLLNLEGKVVGITTLGYNNPNDPTAPIGFINFAIPSNKIARIVPELISNGTYQHAWLGIDVIDVTPYIAENIGLSEARGSVVYAVSPGSPADIAGINTGNTDNRITVLANLFGIMHDKIDINSDADVIIGVDDKQIRQRADLINYIDSKSIGDTVTLKIIREGIIRNVEATLAKSSANQTSVSTSA
jgi:S1-C subfamily serine protease